MSRQIVIYRPRLDISFKEGPVFENRHTPLPPIRQHWANFLNSLEQAHKLRGDIVHTIELPLWQLTPEMADQHDYADIVYIPHKSPRNFPIKAGNAKYYMQTVFPDHFTIDKNGWGPDLSYLPLKIDDLLLNKKEQEWYIKTHDRIEANASKFDQPPTAAYRLPRTWDILFVCQIPHDEVIKYHSKVSVMAALVLVLALARLRKLSVLVKGHPINPGSMEELKKEVALVRSSGVDVTWTESLSIHDCIRQCNKVYMVNSGVGFETILHGKVPRHFGQAEYAQGSIFVEPTIESLEKSLLVEENPSLAGKVMCQFFQNCYSGSDMSTFDKL